MGLFHQALVGARTSKIWRFVLNAALAFRIPFNRPHGLSVSSISESSIAVRLPFRHLNKNHLGGLHACSMATAAEFATGLLLISMLEPDRYRLLMRTLHVEYLYRGATDALASTHLDPAWVNDHVVEPLKHSDSTFLVVESTVHDSEENTLCIAKVEWQIKDWKAVRANSARADQALSNHSKGDALPSGNPKLT